MAKKSKLEVPDREEHDPNEWGNILLPGLSDEELRKTNWYLKKTQAQKDHQSKKIKGSKRTESHKKSISKAQKEKPKPFGKCKFCGTKASTSNLKKHQHNIKQHQR